MAQTQPLETISIEQGLSQGFITGICRDDDGFLWFGTKNGLNRYDGYEFLAFKNDPFDPWSLSANHINAVHDAGEFLCVAAQNQINLFHRRTHRFYRLSQHLNLPSYRWISCEAATANAMWLILEQDDGLHCYQVTWPNDLSQQLLRDPSAIKQVRMAPAFGDMKVRSIDLSFDKKTLWWTTDSGYLGIQTIENGRIEQVPIPIEADRKFGLLAGDAGVLVGNIGQDKFAWYKPNRDNASPWHIWNSVSGAPLTMLDLDDKRQRLWVSAQSELREYDLSRPVKALNQANAHSIIPISGGIRNCLKDPNGILWLGTDAKGIRKFNPGTRLFRHYLEGRSVYCRPVADRLGNIWLSDVRQGISNRIYNCQSGTLKLYPLTGIHLDRYTRVTGSPDGTVWVCGEGTVDHKTVLVHYNPADGKQETFVCPDNINIYNCALYWDEAAKAVWLSDVQQLLRFDGSTRQFTKIPYHILPSDQVGIFALEKTADGSIWLATGMGLVRGTPTPDGHYHFHLLYNNPADRNSLPTNSLKSLLTDPADGMVLWIGTDGNGLCRYDLRSNTFRHYTTRNGLPDDMVYGILVEEANTGNDINLWLSTNKGLVRFNPQTNSFRYFLKSDGLQENEFNTFAYGKAPNGELMFGGVNGLTIFDPKVLSSSAFPAEVRITGLKVNDVAIAPLDSSGILSVGVEFTPPILLSYDRNNLQIQFMATDMTQPSRNQFRYYLEGAEREWAHTGFGHSAQYLNLAPGQYTFRIMAANSEGVWNNQITDLRIRILPPWYASIWAYTAYVVMLAGGLWLLYRYQLRQKLEHAETERLKELDRFKTRFFTNITHEFRTPLTVILGIAEKLRTEGLAPGHSLAMIRRNGENLLRLINQILDLAKLQSNKLELRPEHADLIAFIRYIAEAFRSFADMRDLSVHFQSNRETCFMDFDTEKMQTVLSNLMSNALKFTPAGGSIMVSVQVYPAGQAPHPSVCIAVTDNGVGIPSDKLERIFDRFYQVDNSATRSGEGTGIGLALTKELVRLMQGEIDVKSEAGQGTTFTVRLPMRLQHGTAAAAPMPAAPLAALAPPTADTPEDLLANGADVELPLLLIVEDNADVRQYLVECVRESYRVLTAHNGREGIDKALAYAPDLIVSDVMMPEKDGFELCETLKNDLRSSHIPITLLTARVTVEDRITGLQRGADAYLAKPFHQQELLLQLRNLLQLRRRLQERYAQLAPPAPTDDPGLQMEDAFLQKFREFVEKQIGNAQLSVDDLCRAMGMGRTNLHHKITSLTGLSAMQFVRALRLHKAKQLLERGDLNVSEVAFETGFDDPKYFGRVFAEETGMPPTQWRKKA